MDDEVVTLATDLTDSVANDVIAEVIGKRHNIARRYVLRLRRRHPDADPAELIALLERDYGRTITTAGAVIAGGAIAANLAISLIPVAGVAAAGAKSTGALARKGIALKVAKGASGRMVKFLPAGEEQLQFEITALFALAIADIHGMRLDRDQSHALVYGLSNGRVSAQQISVMAADVAALDTPRDKTVARHDGGGGDDGDGGDDDGEIPWASTLADALPAGRAQNLLRTIQTGHLEPVRDALSAKQQVGVDYAVVALAGGISRFVFGREVVAASRIAFPEPPEEFPAHLQLDLRVDDSEEGEPNRALAALEAAARGTGTWISGTAGSVGNGVSEAALSVSRPFRRVDLDGDGIPDEARVTTAVRGVGSTVTGAAGRARGAVTGLVKRRGTSEAESESTESAESDGFETVIADTSDVAEADRDES